MATARRCDGDIQIASVGRCSACQVPCKLHHAFWLSCYHKLYTPPRGCRWSPQAFFSSSPTSDTTRREIHRPRKMSSQEAAAAAAAAGAKGTSQTAAPYPDHNQGPKLVRVVWVLVGISAAIVLGRLWTKLRKAHRLYWDDCLMVLALVRLPRRLHLSARHTEPRTGVRRRILISGDSRRLKRSRQTHALPQRERAHEDTTYGHLVFGMGLSESYGRPNGVLRYSAVPHGHRSSRKEVARMGLHDPSICGKLAHRQHSSFER